MPLPTQPHSLVLNTVLALHCKDYTLVKKQMTDLWTLALRGFTDLPFRSSSNVTVSEKPPALTPIPLWFHPTLVTAWPTLMYLSPATSLRRKGLHLSWPHPSACGTVRNSVKACLRHALNAWLPILWSPRPIETDEAYPTGAKEEMFTVSVMNPDWHGSVWYCPAKQ